MVAAVPLLVNEMTMTPLVFVNVAKVNPPDCKLAPLTVKREPAVSNPNRSEVRATVGLCTVKVAPAQSPFPPFKTAKFASLSVALPLSSKVTLPPTPAQTT